MGKSESPAPLGTSDLLELSGPGYAAAEVSPLSAQPFLLLDAQAGELTEAGQKQIAQWLRQLPCPVLGIAAADDRNPVAFACDALLPGVAAAQPLINNIRRSPMAAAALTQVLRVTAELPIAKALTVESLAYSMLQSGPEFGRWLEGRRPASPPPAEDGAPVALQRDGETLTLELNRPANHNAMSVEMRDALVEALQLVLADSSIRSVRISGRGKCFSTGGDLSEFGTLPDPATAHFVRCLAVPGRYLAQCAARAEVFVHGACIGSGIEFPAFARRVVARADAHFQLPELRFGLIPGAGGCVGIARRIGRQRTAWLALSGKRINAATALEWGLVDAVQAE